jgi:hypothetical protein
VLLILSARTVNEDIALHYGRLPPSFLPLGNQRLFGLQAELAGGGPVAMTVPESFVIPARDMADINAAGIQLLPQPMSLSLTEAICAAIKVLKPEGPLRLLYGDTLVRLDQDQTGITDRVVVQSTTSNYPWAYVTQTPQGDVRFSGEPPQQIDTRQVVCGDYLFSDPAFLVEACASGNIIDALNTYHARHPLTRVTADEWFDFGHLPLYFQSKKSIMVKRVFNRLAYENHLLVKQSDDTAKMRAEANWYETLAPALQIHTPRYAGRMERDHRAGYGIEYLYHPLLGDLAAFGYLPFSSWLEILQASFDLLDKFQAIRPEPGAPEASPRFAAHFFDSMVKGKTWQRLDSYLEGQPFSLGDSLVVNGVRFRPLREVVQTVIDAIPVTRPDHVRAWHGDMFFGNMFYDFTARRVMAIDPRGQIGAGELCVFGDWRYDLAKLSHSVIGQYDSIVLTRGTLETQGPTDWTLTLTGLDAQPQLEEVFISQAVARYGIAPSELIALTALLFYSMLPLHHDRPDLQQQMLANALRLSGRIEGTTL